MNWRSRRKISNKQTFYNLKTFCFKNVRILQRLHGVGFSFAHWGFPRNKIVQMCFHGYETINVASLAVLFGGGGGIFCF